MRGYTEAQIAWLKKNVKGGEWKTITAAFNQTFGADKGLRALKTYCNRELKIYTGNDGRFKVGHVTWNKCISTEEWEKHLTPEGREKIKATQIKKGEAIRRAKIGSEMVLHRENKDQCVLVKTGEGRYGNKKGWQRKDALVWEQHTGEMPEKNAVIAHLDGDIENCDFENLYLTDRKVFSAALNGYRNETKNKDILKTALMVETLKRQIGEEEDE